MKVLYSKTRGHCCKSAISETATGNREQTSSATILPPLPLDIEIISMQEKQPIEP